MPRFDRTGPQGMGPMTGGARGLCNRINSGNDPGGYGCGRGMAHSRGFRGNFVPGRKTRRGSAVGRYQWSASASTYPLDEENELNILKAQASDIKGALDDIYNRISELEKKI